MYTTARLYAGSVVPSLSEIGSSTKEEMDRRSFGFLWLAMDDRFAIHERIRDHILIRITSPFLSPDWSGDFILLIYADGGFSLAAVVPSDLQIVQTRQLPALSAGGGRRFQYYSTPMIGIAPV